MELRDYQKKGGIFEYQTGYEIKYTGTLCAPHGRRKNLFSQVAADAVRNGESVLVLAHRRELIEQANARLRRFGLNTGLVIAGEEMNTDAQVQVASIQTLVRRFGQRFVSMSPALRTTESIILKNETRYGSHLVLTMCMSNAIVVRDPAGNRKLKKSTATLKIDGAVALAMALRTLQEDGGEAPKRSYLETECLLVL